MAFRIGSLSPRQYDYKAKNSAYCSVRFLCYVTNFYIRIMNFAKFCRFDKSGERFLRLIELNKNKEKYNDYNRKCGQSVENLLP